MAPQPIQSKSRVEIGNRRAERQGYSHPCEGIDDTIVQWIGIGGSGVMNPVFAQRDLQITGDTSWQPNHLH